MEEEKMTRKQALAILNKTLNSYWAQMDYEQWKQCEEEWKRVYEARRVIACAVHGKPKQEEMSSLCELCGLRYTLHFAHEKGRLASTWCCDSCFQQLKAEQKLEEDDQKVEEVKQ